MASERYNAVDREKHWQKVWTERDVFRAGEDRSKPKCYVLEMFPYPSGDLHIGHFRNYSIGDAVWRKLRMDGNDILHPFGWDAFGLPAERAAVREGLHPAAITKRNVDTFRKQIQRLDTGVNTLWPGKTVSDWCTHIRITQLCQHRSITVLHQ